MRTEYKSKQDNKKDIIWEVNIYQHWLRIEIRRTKVLTDYIYIASESPSTRLFTHKRYFMSNLLKQEDSFQVFL